MSLGEFLSPHVSRPTPADERAARAALGIEDGAHLLPMDMSRVPLFIIAAENGDSLSITARCTIPKRYAAALLRQVAEAWAAEAEAEVGE